MSIRYLRTTPVRIDYPYNKPIWISDSTSSTTSSTGALIVTGGAGIGGDVNIAGKIQASAIENSPIGALTPSTGKFTTIDATGNVIIGGNLTVNGSQLYVQGTNTVYTDNLIELHAPAGGVNGTWTSDDGKDIGIRFHYYNVSSKNAAFVFDPPTQIFEFFSEGTENNGVFTGTLGTIKATKFIGDVQGNIDTASKLKTARTITLSGDITGNVSFDGSADVSLFTALGSSGVTVGTYTLATITVNSKGVITSASSGTATTDAIPEGTTNQYFTQARVRSAVSAAAGSGITYTPATGVFSFTMPNSDAITEGTVNLFYTPARAAAAATTAIGQASIGSLVDVDTSTPPANSQVLTWSASLGKWVPRAVTAAASAVSSVNGATGAVVLTTDNLNEGSTNLFYTAARVTAAVGNTSLGELKNVDTTGVFTGQVLAYDGVSQKWKPSTPSSSGGGGAALIIQNNGSSQGVAGTVNFVGAGVSATVINGVTTVTITGTGTAAVDTINGQSGTISLTTDDIPEGSNNFYYTSARVRAEFTGGNGISYVPETGIISLSGGTPTSVNGKTGVVVLTTDDVAEGSNSLYFTTARARSAISITNTPDRLGAITYSSGVLNYAGPSVTDVRGAFTAGTGVTITGGTIAVGQAVGTSSSPTFANLTVQGDFYVLGTTTTINVTQYAVDNNLITMNSTTVGVPALNATLAVSRGSSPTVALRWNEAVDRWEFTNNGTTYYPIAATTDDLAEGSTNLYFTNTRARSAFTAGPGVSITNGQISVDTSSAVTTFNSRVGAITLTSSDVTTALGYTPSNQAGSTFTGRVTVPVGATGGIAFPNNPYGGSGDTASITVVSTGGENIELTIAVGNDSGDTINFVSPSATGVKINGSSIWSTATLNSLSQLSNDAGYLTTNAVASVNSKTGAVVLTADDIADGVTNHFFSRSTLVTELATVSIDALSDVDTTAVPVDGQALVWNAGTSRWIPGNVASGSGGSSSAPGQVYRAQYTADGSLTTFTLPAVPSSTNYALVYVDGVLQGNTVYAIAGNTLTFTNAPLAGSIVEVAIIKFGSGSSSEFTQIAVTGTSTFRDILPETDSTYNIGSAGAKWNNAYIKNLTVTGTATYLSPPQVITQTTLNVANTDITLNAGFTSGTPTQNANIIVQRGDLADATIRWNESTRTWQFSNGTAFYNVPITTDTLTEGTTNLYFTPARARAALTVSGFATYDSATGVLDVQGGISTFNTRTGAITLEAGDVTGALAYTPANRSGDSFTGRVRFREGANFGFGFNDNAFGGSGDSASITLIRAGGATTGENQELRIAVANDTADVINLVAPGNDGVQVNGNRIWHAGNLTKLSQLLNDQNYVTSASIPVTTVAGRTGAVVLTTADVAEGSNLYYTTVRATAAAVAAIAAASIDDLLDVDASAKATGKVLTWDSTVGRWIAKVVGVQEGTITSLNGKQGPGVTLYTDDIPEGSTRLYYTAGRVNTLINQATLDRLLDVNTAGAQDGQALVYHAVSNAWLPRTVAGGGSGGLNIFDENTQVGSGSSTLKFVGAGVTATVVDGVTTVTITGTGTAAVQSVNGASGTVILDTDNVNEGIGLDRRYFTEARARASISIAAGSSLLYDNATGVIAFVDAVTAVAGKTGNVLLNTADVTESSNLYFTAARADARIAAASIDLLSDVTTAGAATGKALVYNSTASEWQPTAIPLTVNSQTGAVSLGVTNLTDVNITTPVQDQFLQYNGTKWVGQFAISDGTVIDGGNLDAPGGASGRTVIVDEHVLNDLKDVNTTGVANGQFLVWNGTAWTPRTAPLYGTRVYQIDGNLSVKSGTRRWYAHEDLTIVKIKAQVDVAPAGRNIVFAVKKNGSTVGTFEIAAGSAFNPISNINITAAEDDYFTVDITQVGSSTPGQHLLVTFVYI
jgi:hypothetical protein